MGSKSGCAIFERFECSNQNFFCKENSENSVHTRRFGGLDFVTIQLKKKKGKESLKDNIFFLRTLLTEGD